MVHQHSIFCILPPHILSEIASRGTSEQRDLALRSLSLSDQIRSVRRTASEYSSFLPARTGAAKQRTVYDAQHGSNLPGTVVRKEGGPPVADVAVNEAYDGAGITYDLYLNIYQRNSIDGKGLPIDSSIHYQKDYDNAFWNGYQMVYGDGDSDLPAAQQLFNRFTIAVDVIGHELTHGVTGSSANLAYWDQSGALNESISDVFGSLVKQYNLKQTADQADWIIGQGLLTNNVKGIGLRSMKAPGTAYDDPVLGKDPQPGTMGAYANMTSDNGGVHINSGIPNHAFYVVAATIGGYAWEKAGLIWYKTLTEKLQERSNFQDAANLTFQAAGELFGNGSLEQNAVKTGWAEVGITVGAASTTVSTPPSTDNSGCLPTLLQQFGLMGTPKSGAK